MKAFYAVCFIVFIAVILVFAYRSIAQTSKPKRATEVHVVIVATEADKADQLLASFSNKKGYKVHLRGVGEQWTGYDFKLRNTLKLAKKLHPNDVLMHLDAYDTYVVADASEVLEKFYKMDANIVVSTEVNLAPNHELDSRKAVIENIYPTAPNRFRWINSGTYIGYAGAIVNLLSSMPDNFHCDMPTGDKTSSCDDQRCFHTHFVKERDKHNMKLDYNQDIFHCMWDVYTFSMGKKRLKSETGSTPCILHGNGPSPPGFGEALKNFKSMGS